MSMDAAILLPPPVALLDIGPDVACLGDFDVTVLRGYLGGLTLSNDPVTPNTIIDIAQGVCTSDDGTVYMIIPAFTKNCNAPWAVGFGNGGLDSGAVLSASTWYHVFVIQRLDTGVTDVLVSQSATAPTMPTNYTKKRRIGSFKTDGSSHILAFSQNGNEFLWVTPVQDVNNFNVTSTFTKTLGSVPTGVKVNALFYGLYTGVSAGDYLTFWCPDQTGAGVNTPTGSVSLYLAVNSQYSAGEFNIRTNISAQINGGTNVSTPANNALYIVTKGWTDTRGQFS